MRFVVLTFGIIQVYIVMELINGSELFDRIVEKGFYSEKNAQGSRFPYLL